MVKYLAGNTSASDLYRNPENARKRMTGPHLFITWQVIADKSARYILPVSRNYRGHISD